MTDVGGNLVGGNTSVHVHPSLIYAGIRSQSYVGIEGQPSVFDLVVLDWESHPIASQDLTVDIVRREWYSVQEKDEQGTLRWVTTVKDIPIETGLSALPTRMAWPKSPLFRLVVACTKPSSRCRIKKGNKQQSSRFIWVAGKEYIPWQQTNDRSFKLVADKESYSVGDTARLLIAQPFEGEHYALVTYERGHIYKQEVILLKGNSTIYELPIGKDMAPVAYVSVVVIKGADENSAPDFKVGMTRLNVDLEQQQLDVTSRRTRDPQDRMKRSLTQ